MQAGGIDKAAVTVSVAVPTGFHELLDQGGAAATALLNPDEARALATWLREAADRADTVGPPLYG